MAMMFRVSAALGVLLCLFHQCVVAHLLTSAFVFPGGTKRTSIAFKLDKPLKASKSSWSVGDDWKTLSSESPENAVPETSEIFNEDLAKQAAQRMEAASSPVELSEEDQWIADAVDEVLNHGLVEQPSPSGPSLYDTFDSYTQSVSFVDEMGHEISMLVNCNQRPEDMLIAEGRALPPLSDEEKNDVSQLVTQTKDGTYEMTDFFKEAATKMYMTHARSQKNEDGGYDIFLDAAGVARWMTKCIGSKVTHHDKSVLTTMSKFAPYGTGRLGEEDFHRIYLSAITDCLNGKHVVASRKSKMELPSVETIWRDIRNHGILSPVEMERQRKAEAIQAEYGGLAEATKVNARGLNMLMDECEIVEWEKDTRASSYDVEDSSNDEGNVDGRKRCSHENVELASDNKTPLRMRDGDFVFIDEESCIGCAQCASASPSSFLMLESGRARTFKQRRAEDVTTAVSVCPVNCMHKVSYQELKEMELARDDGDGRSDHRHMGHSRGHTPLSVAGIDSDANHKSSWYHYLKQKCYMSKDCPKRGCYDCPNFSAPGENPYFKKLQKEAEHVRAKDIVASGTGDMYRKTADL